VTTQASGNASTATDLVALPALGPTGAYRTRKREVIKDTTGMPVAELNLVPPLYVARSIAAQRKAGPMPEAARENALVRAAGIFANSEIGGLDFDAYVRLASRVSGLPVAVARAGAQDVADAAASAFDVVRLARPAGAVDNWRELDAGTGGGVWTRRGEVFAVHASGNAPGVHGSWPQALTLGYRVAVRPSRREPFTAYRLILALREAGFRPEDASYLPTDHAGAAGIVDAADLAMVYGGADVIDKYANSPNVFVNGPGRTKILITAEQDWRPYLDVIVDSIAGLGGTACMNATAVLYEGDAGPLAEAIAQRLSTIEPLPNADERAILPTQPIEQAREMATYLAAKAAGAHPVLGADQVVADVGEGQAALCPAVHLLARPDVDKLNIELAFPCVWVSPWSRSDGLEPLRNSLVLNAITTDDGLIDELVNEPTVANVYSGRFPTHWTARELPHDGHLADFLMRNKGVCRNTPQTKT
jgi:acyl-CoA reductase-like NAD-dependent aldehyde dehydrogenase